MNITAHQVAALRQGLNPSATDAQRELALRQVDHLEDVQLARMTVEQAKEWVRIVTAPIALRALESQMKETA